ncbi:polyprenol phosphomannose-dependent alpha 1,6 mannosyltransferase MptB [Spirosoma endbachense]|uniref:polyprenol phosphomannose-dependent alpha 1,6 mannosyltransferase MptB n=1 Tax=Spirosoma endbachense TaxID=2666025 RepID=UPI00157561BE|nr:polyprenol phosphomannose-dependent alpha 1,6 mannosyltransferase MptB [Spirosoma endbachense]
MIVTPLRFLWLILSATSYVILAYFVPRQEFGWLIGLFTILFLGYAWAIRRIDRQREEPIDRVLFASAIGFRLLLLFAVPCLSDDVYRFVWDGRLLTHGFNPYLYLPSRLVETDLAATASLDRVLFQQLNSPDYFTVYPPLNQAIFGLAAWLSPHSLLGSIVWLRLPILLSEIGSLWLMTRLLRRLNRNPNLALFYGLNPLVILELTGNLHFEAVMLFFTLLAGWWLLTERWIRSAGALALAIGTKLLPLLLLPLIVRWLGWRKGMVYATLAGVFTILQFLPFASLELVQNVGSSVNLYFQKFEFNASVYYVLRSIGYWMKGYNAIQTIGFWLSITTTLSILWISFRWRNVSVPAQVLAILTLYFGFATTVHPWYITTVVAASVFTRFWYPLIWSALIPVSYFTYRTIPYHENLWLTSVEYGIVAVVILLDVIKARQKMPVY